MLVIRSLFGNLDNCEVIRSMVTAKPLTQVDYLRMKATDFYNMAQKFAPFVVKRLQYHYLVDNMVRFLV